MYLRLASPVLAVLFAFAVTSAARGATTCRPPDPCSGPGCAAVSVERPGETSDLATSRRFLIDYPCDLKRGEKVVFILNLHGSGSDGPRQRLYFPAVDLKEKYRLVVATPTAATLTMVGGAEGAGPTWLAEADEAHLRNIAEQVFTRFGRQNIRAFWLASHGLDGFVSDPLICNGYFKDKVDGWLSLSAGRIGQVAVAPGAYGPPRPHGAQPPPAPGGLRPGAPALPSCPISHIFVAGEREIANLPDTSPLAERLNCRLRVRQDDVVDDQPGKVGTDQQGDPAWGGPARPGTARVFVYPGCRGGRIVADVIRLDKGHSEGLEPRVTEALIRLMTGSL